MAALAGALLGFPVLRMHGDYRDRHAGVWEIIRLVLNNWMSLTGGPNGVSVPAPTVFGSSSAAAPKTAGCRSTSFRHRLQPQPQVYFHLCGAVFGGAAGAVHQAPADAHADRPRSEALREDEIACRSLGLNHVLVKLSAFMLAPPPPGWRGVFRHLSGLRQPDLVHLLRVGADPAIVVLGGMGSTLGVVLAAFVLTVAPECCAASRNTGCCCSAC